MTAQPEGGGDAEPGAVPSGSAIDKLIGQVMPTLRADVVRAALGWPAAIEGSTTAARSQTGWPR